MPPQPGQAVLDARVAQTLHLGGSAKLKKLVVRVALVVIALVVAAIAMRWWRDRGREPAPSYVTAPIERGDLLITVTATGTLEPREQVAIGSEVSGRLRQVLVDANSLVVRGQLLAEIDPELLSAQVEQASAQLAQAKAQLAQARATQRETQTSRTRVEGLLASGVAAEQDRDAAIAAAERADAAVLLARAAVEQATATLGLARSNLARTAIRSPIDGIVLVRDADVGQTVVAAFQSPVLFQVAPDLRDMKVSVDVDEADVGNVHEGDAATFTVAAYVGRTFDAKVTSVHNAARLVDRVVSYEAELAVDNRDLALKPGMTVTADIVARKIPDSLLVPAQALRFSPDGADADAGDRVFVLRDGQPQAIAVSVAGQNDTQAAITAPDLALGDIVLVNRK